MKNRLCQPLILLDDRSVLRKEEFSILSFPENPIKHWHFSGFNPLFNPKSKNPCNHILKFSRLQGSKEVPGGFEPPYTVLQTAD